MINTDELNKQIEQLKKENLQLKAELEVYRLTQNTKMSIDQYYISKYISSYNDILAERVNQITKDIVLLQEEYDTLSMEVANIEDIAALNETYKIEISKLETIKNENLLKLETLRNKYQLGKKELKDKQDTLKNATLGYYKTILKSMDAGSGLVMTNVAFVMEQLSEQLYLLILECRALAYQNDLLHEKLEVTEMEVSLLNQELEVKTLDLLKKIETRTNEEIGSMQESIQDEIKQREVLKNELIETFNLRKEADLKVIVDKINFYQITNTPNSKISELLGELIESLCESLKSQETLKNLRTIKEMHLAELLKEKKVLDEHKKRYDSLKIKENDYYQAYMEASKHYDTLVDFLDNAMLAISENAYYFETSKKYLALKQEEQEITVQYNIVITNIEKIEKERQSKTLAGFPSEDIKSLSVRLSELNTEKNRISILLRDVRDAIRLLEQNHENIKLITVLREKEFVEAKLNNLYNRLRSLKVKINKIKEEIKELELTLNNYDKVCNEIKELENELNN